MAVEEKYNMGFTTSGLMRHESVAIGALYLKYKDWNQVRNEALAQNLTGSKTLQNTKDVYRKICRRLVNLSEEEMAFLGSDFSQDVNSVLWLAICRTYKFVGDFAREVVYEKYISMDRQLERSDYMIFYEQKSLTHPELLKIADSTQARLRAMVFCLLRNVELLTKDGEIQPMLKNPVLECLLRNNRLEDLLFFPGSNNIRKG